MNLEGIKAAITHNNVRHVKIFSGENLQNEILGMDSSTRLNNYLDLFFKLNSDLQNIKIIGASDRIKAQNWKGAYKWDLTIEKQFRAS